MYSNIFVNIIATVHFMWSCIARIYVKISISILKSVHICVYVMVTYNVYSYKKYTGILCKHVHT